MSCLITTHHVLPHFSRTYVAFTGFRSGYVREYLTPAPIHAGHEIPIAFSGGVSGLQK